MTKANSKTQKSNYNSAKSIHSAILKGRRISHLEQLGLKRFKANLDKKFNDPPRSAMPPVTRSRSQETRDTPSYIALFETLSLAIRKLAFSNPSKEQLRGRVYRGSEIRKAIAELVHVGKPENFKAKKAEPHSLKMMGCIIEGDLDLSNLKIPGSIRLVGCWIKGGLILDRTELVTLELSGSVIEKGVSGMYLTTHGAIRLRRTVSMGPIDLGGLTSAGTADFTDCIFYPENSPSDRASHVLDRGILNLAQAKLNKDLRFERARIYGGINMRGAYVGGMLHMNDALLRSAMAHFEFLVAKVVEHLESHNRGTVNQLPGPVQSSLNASVRIAEHLHPKDAKLDKRYHGEFSSYKRRRKWEILGGEINSKLNLKADDSLQVRLLLETKRTAESALRAEQATIDGPIYARGMRVCGRLRMKRLTTSGTVSFNGSRLRGSTDVRIGLTALETSFDHAMGRRKLKKTSNLGKRARGVRFAFDAINDQYDFHQGATPDADHEKYGDGDVKPHREYVLDLENAVIGGPLDLSRDPRPRRIVTAFEPVLSELLTVARDTIVEKYNDFSPFKDKPPTFSGDLLPAHFQEGFPDASHRFITDYHPTLIIGEIRLDNAKIAGTVDLRNAVFNLSKEYPCRLRTSLRARNVKVGRDIDLRHTVGLNGLSLTSAHIEGSIRSCDVEEGPNDSPGQPSLGRRSICHPIFDCKDHIPVFDLSLTTIDGDVFLQSHPKFGPTLHLGNANVGGRTYIVPTDNVFAERDNLPTRKRDVVKAENYSVIDLSGLKTPFLSHNSGAWPVPGNLIIRNVRYDTTDRYGHLFPRPRSEVEIESDKNENRKLIQILQVATPVLAIIIAFAVVVLSYFECPAVCWSIPVWLINFNNAYDSALALVGKENFYAFWGFLMFGLVVYLIARLTHPVPRKSAPLALSWLRRQKTHFNTRRIEHHLIPAEPYIRAAAVLRAESRNTSADRVEVERLRERRRALSWPKAWAGLLLLYFLDLFIQYGFKPTRAIALTGLYVLVSSMVFHALKMQGVIVPSDTVELYEEKRVLGRHGDRGDHNLGDSVNPSQPSATVTTQQRASQPDVPLTKDCPTALRELKDNHFHSFVYSVDSLIPFIDIDANSDWKIMDPKRLTSILNCTDSDLKREPVPSDFAYYLAILLKLVGWSLMTALALSLLTRMETLLIRPGS